jgi:putative oxidoreductase
MFAGMLTNLGIPAPGPMAWIVGIVEFFGGLALILGFLVRPAAALLTIDMLVAMFKVHLSQGFNFMHITGMTDTGPTFGMPGYEVNLLYIGGLLSLLLSGGGALSHRKRREGRGST